MTSEESSAFSSPARNRDIGAGDSLDYEEYTYLSMALPDQLPDINSKGNYVSEYMGEIPSNLGKATKKNNSKTDLLPNKTSKASLTKGNIEEKSTRKSSSQTRNQSSSSAMQYDQLHTESAMQYEQLQSRNNATQYDQLQGRNTESVMQYEQLQSRNTQNSMQYDQLQGRNTESAMQYDQLQSRNIQSSMQYEQLQSRNTESVMQYEQLQSRNTQPMSMVSKGAVMMSYDRMNTVDLEEDSYDTYDVESSRPAAVGRHPPISKATDSSMTSSFETRLSSPPVPALLKKMQMGFSPDEYGRMSSLQNEIEGSPPHSRPGSRILTSGPKIDIDIAVTQRPDFKETIFEQSEGTESSHTKEENDTRAGTRDSSHSKSLESSNNGIDFYDVPAGGFDVVVGVDPKESGRSNVSYRSVDRPLTNASSTDLSRQERFIYSVMSNDDVQAQLSARESELSEKGIIEFSVRLPAQTQTHNIYRHDMPGHKLSKKRSMDVNNKQTSVESSLDDEYQDPLLSARRNCVRWLYSSDDSPKESVLTHLSYLKKGIMMQQQEWGVVPSDTEEDIYESRR